MMDDPYPFLWSEVPDDEKARLKTREAAQRSETARRGLTAWPVSVKGLWLVQRGMCTCPKCQGQVPLDPFAKAGTPQRIVIAHVFFRAGVGSPGHVPHNLALWSHACNAREARSENIARGKSNRFAVNKVPAVDKPAPKQKSKWPKGRKIQSKGFGK